MGDSYMSGEGAEAFLPGTDGPDNKCRRAAHAYPILVAQQLGADLTFVACSGAVVENIVSVGSPPLLIPTPHPRSEHRQQIEALKQRPNADLVFLSVGGNDAKFAEIIAHCMGIRKQCSDVGGAWLEHLREVVVARLNVLLDEIRAVAPTARVLVMTYPAPLGARQQECASVGLSESEAGFLTRYGETLKRHIDAAAIGRGAEPIDLLNAFDGHGLCSGSQTAALNGWRLQKPAAMSFSTLDGVDVVRGSFHPTAYGHRLMAERILNHLANFRRGPGGSPPPPPPPGGTDVPDDQNPTSRFGLPSNPCTPNVSGRDQIESAAQSLDVRDALPGSAICYRIANDPWSKKTVGPDGTVQLQFDRPPVAGESGLRQLIYSRADGIWWFREVASAAATPAEELTLIDAWFGGRPQMLVALASVVVTLAIPGYGLLSLVLWRRARALKSSG